MHLFNQVFIYFTLFITALLVGIVGNAIGIGGGILLVPFFIFYMHLSPLESSGLSLFTIMISTAGGSYIFYKINYFDKHGEEALKNNEIDSRSYFRGHIRKKLKEAHNTKNN